MPDKTVAEKLMMKEGRTVLIANPPQGYDATLGPLPPGVTLTKSGESADVIQVFVASRAELERELPRLKQHVKPGGMLWVTYYKGTSKTKTDINRDTINAYAKSLGMQGVAMVSVDDDWAALRLKMV